METTVRTIAGVALLITGAVLLLFFRDADLGWFRGQPLGILLAAVGVVDLVEIARRRGRDPGRRQ